MIARRLVIISLILSFVGIIDSGYLSVKHYSETPLACFIGENCDLVIKSSYSEIFGIPVALLGVFYYLSVFVLLAVYLRAKNKMILLCALFATPAGFIASLWFLYLQAFVIGAFCQYCLLSAATSITLFVLAIFMIKSMRNHQLKVGNIQHFQ